MRTWIATTARVIVPVGLVQGVSIALENEVDVLGRHAAHLFVCLVERRVENVPDLPSNSVQQVIESRAFRPERFDEWLQAVVVSPVLRYFFLERVKLARSRQLAIQHQESRLFKRCMLGQHFNRVATVLQDALLSVDEADSRNAVDRIHVSRVKTAGHFSVEVLDETELGGVDRAVYAATKHAVEGFTKSMAIEWGSLGIRVNTICPTFVVTPLTKQTFDRPERRAWVEEKIKLGRVGEVEDVMGAAVFLGSDAAALITGTALMVDGGWTAD